MSYRVRFAEKALRQLKKLDKPVQQMILNWLQKNLEGLEEPRLKGKALVSNHSGEWRYRIADYRLIAVIQDEIVTILIIAVGHRKDIYK